VIVPDDVIAETTSQNRQERTARQGDVLSTRVCRTIDNVIRMKIGYVIVVESNDSHLLSSARVTQRSRVSRAQAFWRETNAQTLHLQRFQSN
jgi:hypothetical protein